MHFKESKGILSSKNGMNIYRGCSHGCIYCDSRSVCYQMDHEFEDIEVKINAPQLLEDALRRKRSRCMIGTGSMCDPYLHIEKELCLTRKCLEIIDRYGFGASLLTKSDLVLRDKDLLCNINKKSKAVVQMTITTADEKLCSLIEPNVCTTKRRFEVLREMHDCGIPTVVWLSPLLPFINDTEENIRAILDGCIKNGVTAILCFGIGVTLREGDREYFYSALDKSFPGVKHKYIEKFGNAYECNSDNNKELMCILRDGCKQNGIMFGGSNIFDYLNEFPENKNFEQLSLF